MSCIRADVQPYDRSEVETKRVDVTAADIAAVSEAKPFKVVCISG